MPERESSSDEYELLILSGEVSKDTPTLNLHGKTVGEAQTEIDQFLYREFKAGKRVVAIIHGKGTGVLQKAAAEILSKHPLVERWRPSTKLGQEGGVVYVALPEKP